MDESLLKRMQEFLALVGTFGTEGVFQQYIADAVGSFESKYLSKLGVEVGAQDFAPFGAISYWNRINKQIMNTNQQLGIAGNLGRNIQSSFRDSLMDAADIGATYKDISQEYRSFVDELGRSRQLTSQELVDLVQFQKLFDESAAQIFAVYSELGVSFAQTSKDIQQIGVDSNKVGVNYSKVFKELQSNLNVINRLTFVKGRRGMQEMAKLAVQTRISMRSAADFADKIFDEGIEGAIEMSANMQILGGQVAQLGDPFELFYLARNAPEELQKRVADMTKEFASFNRTTGEIDINALGMSRLREVAKTTGISLEEMAQSARLARKEAEIKGRFDFSIRGKGDFDDMLTKVAGIAEFDTNVNDWVVKIGEESKKISELTPEMIGQLDFLGTDQVADVNERLIKSNESLNETMQRLVDQMKLGIMEGTTENYQQMYDVTREFADSIKESMASGGMKQVMSFFKGLASTSFQNFMEVYKKLGEGDVVGAGGIALDRIGNAVLGVLTAIGQTLLLILEAVGGLIAWSVSSLIAGLGNVFIDVGNAIVRAISFGFVPEAMGSLTSPEISDFLPDLGEYLQKVLPEFISSNLPQDALDFDINIPEIRTQGGGVNEDAFNQGLERQRADETRRIREVMDRNQETNQPSIDLNVNGGIDLTGFDMSPQDTEALERRLMETIEDYLTARNMGGGVSTRSR